MNKIDLIIRLLDEKEIPMLDKNRDLTIQEYMKLKHDSIKAIADVVKKSKN